MYAYQVSNKMEWWFPFGTKILRKEKRFIEYHARTSRLYNSQLYYMRRILNENEIPEYVRRIRFRVNFLRFILCITTFLRFFLKITTKRRKEMT